MRIEGAPSLFPGSPSDFCGIYCMLLHSFLSHTIPYVTNGSGYTHPHIVTQIGLTACYTFLPFCVIIILNFTSNYLYNKSSHLNTYTAKIIFRPTVSLAHNYDKRLLATQKVAEIYKPEPKHTIQNEILQVNSDN